MNYSSVSTGKYIKIIFTEFKNCESNTSGGAGYVDDVITFWLNCVFKDNTALIQGFSFYFYFYFFFR
jgi:hypothetical protein